MLCCVASDWETFPAASKLASSLPTKKSGKNLSKEKLGFAENLDRTQGDQMSFPNSPTSSKVTQNVDQPMLCKNEIPSK
jgi:hypothetical protein